MSTIGKCPICDKDAEAIDSKSEANAKLEPCDENEFFRCYTSTEHKINFVQRKRKKREIDWDNVL